MAKKAPNNYDEVLQALADNVKQRRRELGLTQQQLSRKAGLFHNYIGRLEGRIDNPTLRPLVQIANALGLSLSELLPPAKRRK